MNNDPNSTAATKSHRFILFVSGMSAKSVYAIENIRRICDRYLPGEYDLQIIDINKEQAQAIAYQVIAIPTLIRTSPEPLKTILGDLSDTRKILRILDITA